MAINSKTKAKEGAKLKTEKPLTLLELNAFANKIGENVEAEEKKTALKYLNGLKG